MAKQIQTFGYEGLTIAQFIEQLKRSGTRVVIDVRANPLSRKHGFSKKSFAKYLEAAGIRYVHAVGVGCPRSVRDRYRTDNDWSAYTKGYLAFLKQQRQCISEIAKAASIETVCLVCFEADYTRCHRSFVADAVAALVNISIKHLKVGATTDRRGRVAA